jgi:hypothetical protein
MPVTRELSIRAELLEVGGPPLWDDFMEELREIHLGKPHNSAISSVSERLREAYLDALTRAEDA